VRESTAFSLFTATCGQVSTTFWNRKRIMCAAYVFFLVFHRFYPSLLSFPLVMCFRRQFLRTVWPIQLYFHLFTVCTIFLSPLSPRDTPFLTRLVQLIFSILLHHHTSKLSEVSMFQHHTKLCSKCGTELVPSVNLASNFLLEIFPQMYLVTKPIHFYRLCSSKGKPGWLETKWYTSASGLCR